LKKKLSTLQCVDAPALVFLLLSRLAGADEEDSVRIIVCIGGSKSSFEGLEG
jgi:hypothetical protein